MTDERLVEVFTQPGCAACRQVERYLEQRGVPYEVRDVLEDASALDELMQRGYMQTPVTRCGDQWIAGFDRAALDTLVASR